MRYLIIFIFVGLGAGWYWWQVSPETALVDNTKGTQSEQVGETSSKNIYRNNNWGITFEYPNDWEIREPAFGSSVSLFNLALKSSVENSLPDPVIINITPKYWVDRIINSTQSKEFRTYEIDNREAIYYLSEDMGIPTWSYFVLINNTYWINISGKNGYEDVLNQVISSLSITPVEIKPVE